MPKPFIQLLLKSAILILLEHCFMFSSMAQPDIGLELYSLRSQLPKDVPGTLQKIKQMGITKLEGGDSYGMPLPDFKKLLDANGLKMIRIGIDFNKLQDPSATI